MSDHGLTHLDPLGRARMVDVTPKEPTHRRAIARCRVYMQPETTNKIASNAVLKATIGAITKKILSTWAGMTSSLRNILPPSAIGCSNPYGPTRLGPKRSCTHAATQRSNRIRYAMYPMMTPTTAAIMRPVYIQLNSGIGLHRLEGEAGGTLGGLRVRQGGERGESLRQFLAHGRRLR